MNQILQFALLILTKLSTLSLHFDDTADDYFHGSQRSPDGKWIAFTRVNRFSNPDSHDDWVQDVSLYIQNYKTRQTKRLVTVKGRNGVPVTAGWSPDSKRVLFWSLNSYGSSSSNADGSGLRDISLSGGRSRYFGHMKRETGTYVFSPNGKHLSIVEGGWRFWVADKRIAVYNYKTGAKHWVSASKAASIDPTWSPDSKRIAFIATADARPLGDTTDIIARRRKSHLWIVQRDGSGRRQLTHDSRFYEASPKWSPDGKTIRFTRVTSNDSEVNSSWEIRRNGTGLKKLKETANHRTSK